MHLKPTTHFPFDVTSQLEEGEDRASDAATNISLLGFILALTKETLSNYSKQLGCSRTEDKQTWV